MFDFNFLMSVLVEIGSLNIFFSSSLLPRVLFRVGQIVATPTMALPVLEFLHSITSVPEMYVDFVEKEYLSVFGVALTYTDPK